MPALGLQPILTDSPYRSKIAAGHRERTVADGTNVGRRLR
jgi:hypothetical protein